MFLQSKSTPTIETPDLTCLYRLDIDYSDPEKASTTNALLNALLSPLAPPNIVRQISVTGYPSLGNWTLVAEGFEHFSRLQDVYWEGEKAITKRILIALEEKNPSCRLRYTPSFSYWDPYDEDVPPVQVISDEPHHERRAREREVILGSKVLYSLKAEIEYGANSNLEDLELVFRVLGSCPNLKELDLAITVRLLLLLVLGAKFASRAYFAGKQYLGPQSMSLASVSQLP
jgi:hypothetical protein